MKHRKILTFLLCIALCLSMTFVGCTSENGGDTTSGGETTTAPETTEGKADSTTAEVTTTEEETTTEPPEEDENSFKVLAIGNSFSEDSLEHLYKVAADLGAENICVANLYIGGCSLQMHYNNAKANSASYTFRYNDSNKWENKGSASIETGVKYTDWDVIVLQQVSGNSGMTYTYDPFVSYLADYVRERATNPDVKLAWHMTWAYQANSTHGSFANYDKNQMTMYEAILNCVDKKILPLNKFDYIIPTGTAIQNVRTSLIGDTLTRDGYHLGWNMGRYIASLTWYAALSGDSIDDVKWKTSDVDETELAAIIEAVNNAIEKPYEVTESTHK